MLVEDLMSRSVKCCQAETDLATAAQMMFEGDFGVLPIVDQEEHVKGVLTDRDICLAVTAKRQSAMDLKAAETISGKAYCVHMNDDIHEALKQMKAHRVRRLPVLNAEDKLQGMISINDIILDAHEKGPDHPSYGEAMETLKGICFHRPTDPQPEAQAKLSPPS
jgi:CBS domain-containing protein